MANQEFSMRQKHALTNTLIKSSIGVAVAFALAYSAHLGLEYLVKEEVDANAKELLESAKLETRSVFFNMAEAKAIGTTIDNSDQKDRKTLQKIAQKYKFNDVGGEQWASVDGHWWGYTMLSNPPLIAALGLYKRDITSFYQLTLGDSPSLTKLMAMQDGVAIRVNDYVNAYLHPKGPLAQINRPVWLSQKDACHYVEAQKLTCASAGGEYQLDIKIIGEQTLVTVNESGLDPFYLF
ncbi:hypothetical protein ACYSUW_13355 [Pseudomonas frederiksbergensis]